MKFHCVLPSLVCVALLSACATSPAPAEKPIARTTSIKAAMAEANAAALSGHPDKAYALLKQASATYPADKAPWVRMAQMRFDGNNYGEAIVNALEALHRDPDDTLANSVVAVSGLRLSSKALADLTRKNNLSGTVRTEAQDLARLLRNSLGEEVLVPVVRPAPRNAPVKPKAPTATTAPTATAAATTPTKSNGDPFGTLK
jgi:tetratricopeptide (TPR) repeat protein